MEMTKSRVLIIGGSVGGLFAANLLRSVGWNRTHAARILGISLPTLRSKIRKFGIDPSES